MNDFIETGFFLGMIWYDWIGLLGLVLIFISAVFSSHVYTIYPFVCGIGLLLIYLLISSISSPNTSKEKFIEETYSNGNIKVVREYTTISSWFSDSKTYNSGYDEYWENKQIKKSVSLDEDGFIYDEDYVSRDFNSGYSKSFSEGVKTRHRIWSNNKYGSQESLE